MKIQLSENESKAIEKIKFIITSLWAAINPIFKINRTQKRRMQSDTYKSGSYKWNNNHLDIEVNEQYFIENIELLGNIAIKFTGVLESFISWSKFGETLTDKLQEAWDDIKTISVKDIYPVDIDFFNWDRCIDNEYEILQLWEIVTATGVHIDVVHAKHDEIIVYNHEGNTIKAFHYHSVIPDTTIVSLINMLTAEKIIRKPSNEILDKIKYKEDGTDEQDMGLEKEDSLDTKRPAFNFVGKTKDSIDAIVKSEARDGVREARTVYLEHLKKPHTTQYPNE